MKPLNNTPTSSQADTGPRYWRSLNDLAQTPEFRAQVESEFGPGASELSEVDRRNFFKIMAASFAIGGVGFSGCRRPESHILPYSKMPENVIPGQPLYYATSFTLRGESVPILVETHTGRPTKIEGNPDLAEYNGATSLKCQASTLDLYDPERATINKKDGGKISKAESLDLIARLKDELGSTAGKGIAYLTEASNSPTRQRLKSAFQEAYPEANWVEYDAAGSKSPAKAAEIVAGKGLEPRYDFSKAKRVLSVEGDFLEGDHGHLAYARQFMDGRRVRTNKDPMNRLYIAESNFSLTGTMADHRKRLATSQMVPFLAAAALEVLEIGVEAEKLKPVLTEIASSLDQSTREWIRVCMEDLLEHKGECSVYVGQQLGVEAQALGLLINEKLGNLRSTVNFVEVGENKANDIAELAADISSGNIHTLIIAGGNPVYNAPADLGFGELIKSVNNVVRLGYQNDETTAVANYHVVESHYLEAWGDGRTHYGTITAQQPMILPMFDGISEIEFLARLIGLENTDGHSLVFETLDAGKRAFDKFLHDGFVEGTEYKTNFSNVGGLNIIDDLENYKVPEAPTGAENLEAVFFNDSKIDDGRYANNGWLQECPEPMTKLTWDNAVIISPRLAKELDIVAPDSAIQVARKNPNKVRDGRQFAPIAEVTVGERKIRGAIHIQPGLDNYTIILPLGYGRTEVGRVGRNGASFNAFSVREEEGRTFATGVKLELTGESYQLASTQEHWSMEGRAIVREANKSTYEKDKDWVSKLGMESHSPPIYGEDTDMPDHIRVSETPRGNSQYEHPNLDGVHQWGMVIDLNVCTGCNACVVACQAENNIPIVGRDQVRRGREMHWMRLDRYFSSSEVVKDGQGHPVLDEDGKTSLDYAAIPEDPQVSLQPISCLHCETAPCETVCPVNATAHDEEGINT
ncbi:MAG: TAT-variant-translocated molybdopterin oxidoreductase, partial [Verrucomicrobiota bacterium]